MSNIIILDTETTGLRSDYDEILQIGAVDLEGNILYNGYFTPEHMKEWPEAEIINGISPDFIRNGNFPYIKNELSKLDNILGIADKVAGYNTRFDLQFLLKAGVNFKSDAVLIDVMNSFAPVMGEKMSWERKGRSYQGFRCQKLTTAAGYYNYNWNDYGAHDAVGDAKATAFVLRQIAKEHPELLTAEEWVIESRTGR